jgi:hypothetical protein
MNIVISIHIFPTELGNYGRIVTDLNNAYSRIDPSIHNVIVHATLNLNSLIVKWKESPVNRMDVIAHWQNINTDLKIPHQCVYVDDKNFMGVNEHRRLCIQTYQTTDSIVFLDPDLYFNETILETHILAYEHIQDKSEYFIVVPQVVKLWDDTWDCIVNNKYIHETHNYHKHTNPSEIVNTRYGPTSVEQIDEFKWGGGWFNSISPKLLSLIGIPKSFVGYGPDDTFIMVGSSILKHRGYDIQQYILKNTLVAEAYTDNHSTIFSKIPMSDMRHTFRYNAEHNFTSEIQKLKAKL